ncbi:MAG: AEC family transporter [Lacrimispora saccharolytica]
MSTGVVFQQMLVIFLLIAVGVFLYRKKAVTEVTSRQLSGLITNICNPALMIASVFSDEMPATRQDILLTAGIAAGTYVFAIAAGILVPRLLRVEPQERKYYHMMMVYGNTGFIGIPLVSALLGEGAVIYVTVFNFFCNCSGLLFLTHRFFVKTEKIIFLFCLEISMFVDNSGSYLYMKP